MFWNHPASLYLFWGGKSTRKEYKSIYILCISPQWWEYVFCRSLSLRRTKLIWTPKTVTSRERRAQSCPDQSPHVSILPCAKDDTFNDLCAAWHFKCKFVLCCWWSPVDKGFGLTMALRIPSQVATRHCPSRVDTNAANAVITAIAISWGVTIYFYTAAQTSSCAIRSLETVHVGTLLNWRPLGICTLFTC